MAPTKRARIKMEDMHIKQERLPTHVATGGKTKQNIVVLHSKRRRRNKGTALVLAAGTELVREDDLSAQLDVLTVTEVTATKIWIKSRIAQASN